VVICADHGLTNVPDERRFVLEENDPLSYYLVTQPSAEPSIPVFHVQPGQQEDFKTEFLERFGEYFVLITPEDIEELKLMGPGALSPVLKKRLGSFMAICTEPSKIYFKPLYKTHPEYIGVHGGLTREEMQVPLIVV
jgi:hypothetical protein